MLFGIFVLVYEDQQDNYTYIIDDINTCTWESGVVVSASEAFDTELETRMVDPDVEDDFLAEAADTNLCTAKEGDTSGFYAPQLNKQFDAQQ